MLDRSTFEQMQQRLADLIAQTPAQDLEANIKAMLASFFARIDLVTREEFDIQREVLKRTREKLEQLEAKLAQLEAAQSSTAQVGGAPTAPAGAAGAGASPEQG